MAAVDVTDATFETEVLVRSSQVPIVLDLWAPWCGPCQTLGPIIEKAIDTTAGAVVLAKLNIDENPQVAAALRVQSIPLVVAFRDGQPVDGFLGARPEQEVEQWVASLLPAPSEADQLVAAGDEASLRRALELEPDHPGAIVALAELLVQREVSNPSGEAASAASDEALALLARIPETAETRRVAALARVGVSATAGATQDIERRLDTLLDQVKGDEEARQEYVDLLEVLGADDPRTAQYRRALTSRLY
jgi:putative thioredoxin